ncbi:putative alpha,alpha-trehalose-phosphate synthase (UDP-forming) [Helianthus annuus]|uniref:Alpha,alpha-trehalose-phosphate synthase (UDP-forming) n=1 Tax=Helianthus annuus TaxID=4232 RepID=A0A9K3ITC8_HELAN|nr:putative alpha,alpha-trehalose-phosphate synthase (UDP-forming) [Helianthus annuus]
MLSRSSFNLLNLDDYSIYSCVTDRPRIPRIMTVPGILSEFEEHNVSGKLEKETEQSDVVSSVTDRRIIVSNQLPVKAYRESNKWVFEYDSDSLVLQLKSGFGPDVECVYVGSLPVDIDPVEQEEVGQILLDKFKCVPTFLSVDIQNKYYHGFCKHYLWPLFHYMLPVTRTHGVRFDRVAWQAYVSANKIFADKVMEVFNPDEDYVWIHDYHLMVMPTFLRKRFHRVRVGFFLHSPFPSSEIYRTLPVRDEILRALLNCDLIGFHTFDYARHFLSSCSRMLGLDYKSKRGYIGLEYYGRTVSIKILPVGIHMGQIESVKSSNRTAKKVEELRKVYGGKVVILGVDDMDMFKGISLKFLAMGQLLEEYPALRGRVVLVQILNPARSRGHDIQEVENETQKVASEVNRRFGKDGYEPIVFVNGPVSTHDKIAYYAISECVVVNAVRDGMNLVPYKYTVSREVWHHQEADPDFGMWQAKELLDHLESVLANEPVVVKRGQQIVEVNPQGVSKGVVVESLIASMHSKGRPLDFVLCIGDDRSDEDMFEKISSSVVNRGIAEVFACTVGQKPSMAKYYLDDTVDVIKMLHGLESASTQVPKTSAMGVSFETSF